MPDYGLPLEFGSFITPLAEDPARTVDLAIASEAAGLDLVTFQDHPYQRRFLDTWTLMSWVGARTDRIRISANVHNLPLRPPAMLARAAASLDLLTGGRIALALGAGGFPGPAAAMGAPERTPAESIEIKSCGCQGSGSKRKLCTWAPCLRQSLATSSAALRLTAVSPQLVIISKS